MKKFILTVALLTYLLLLVSSFNAYAQSSDCWQEFNDQKIACNESSTICNKCFGSNVDPACSQNCDKATNKCTQAVDALHSCLGVDKQPLKVEPVKPGYLSCEEWKKLTVVGTAQNCTVPAWSLPKKYLKCLSSAEEIIQEMNHPIDYVLDFDENSCNITADDLRQIKEGLPLTSGSSAETSQKIGIVQKSQSSNPISKFVRDVGNYFKPSGVNTGKDVKPDFSVDKPPFKDPKTVSEEAKMFSSAQAINSWIEEIFGEAAPVIQISDPETLNRVPKLDDQTVNRTKQKFDPQKSPYQVPVLDGEVMVKLPGSNDWTPVKEGDRIAPGSSIFTGMDSRMLLLIQDKGIIEVLPFTEITVSKQGLEQADKEGKTSVDVKLRTGEIEVNVEGGIYTGGFQIQMTNGVAGVRGTHFWVNYNSSKGVSIVGVYRGTVDVKDNLGSEKAISPQNDKTEVVLVSKQFSTTKLILYGLLVVVAGGLIIFFKRRSMKTLVSKKKTSR